ncbi:MAG: FxsA family protein [Alphaproteobacteria bacterium]|nr:FxsA family protein [Alphaproteobacteria bacterium]
MPLLFLLLPALEIYLYVLLGGAIGTWATLGVVLGAIVVGSAILRFQGFSLLLRARRALQEGKEPAGPIIEGVAVLIAGLLLIAPGIMTDFLALLLLSPPVRRALIGLFAKTIARHLRGEVHVTTMDETDIVDTTFSEVPPEPPAAIGAPPLPSTEKR